MAFAWSSDSRLLRDDGSFGRARSLVVRPRVNSGRSCWSTRSSRRYGAATEIKEQTIAPDLSPRRQRLSSPLPKRGFTVGSLSIEAGMPGSRPSRCSRVRGPRMAEVADGLADDEGARQQDERMDASRPENARQVRDRGRARASWVIGAD